ncbi:expressed unknown protein [Seminavis robusta]|uniref:BTB domain-containing protein n=1 Tax=Seminavis robusta TaxID=568900 RepID=A0A9N8F263_9STRA|nr:expressed unknown protein [Seminavis robusta]|eukprot:Sro3378_g347421.1  (413) ;mRNA; r:5135-6373
METMETATTLVDKEISIKEMLKSFLTDEALNDVTLKGTDEVEVPANRFLLCARSQVFRGMLLGKFQEASSPVVELGFKGGTLKAVVEYMLTDSADMLSCKKSENPDVDQISVDFPLIPSLVSLAEAASYFQLPNLAKLVLKKFEQMCEVAPGLSFAILQACKVAGPSIPVGIADKIMARVRTTPFELITKEHVDCLSADILKEILTDKQMEKTEYQLFQILDLWAQGKKSECSIIANELSRHISFEKINPEALATTVTKSGLVSSEQLLEAFKQQALEMYKASLCATFDRARCPWLEVLIPSRGLPMEIKVEGAGAEGVNGVYFQDGSFNGKCKYSKEGVYEGNPCVFWLFSDTWWYVSIPDENFPGSTTDKDFYRSATDHFEENELPAPSTVWEIEDYGIEPTPQLKYRYP